MKTNTVYTSAWLFIFFSTLLWSAIAPNDALTWLLEALPAIIALIILTFTRKTFPLTTLAYLLILIHAVILMVGAHYTYAEVPLFDSLAELMGSERNNYDKLGHFVQGITPAIITREIVIRQDVITSSRWMNFFVICVCLAVSAFYELIEWWIALASGKSADAFLGTQGYIWDTQSDMMFALIGAITALLTLSYLHDRQLSSINRKR